MSLVDCFECNHKISDTAESCINCGAKKKPEFSALILVFSGLFILINVIYGFIFLNVMLSKNVFDQAAVPKVAVIWASLSLIIFMIIRLIKMKVFNFNIKKPQ